MDTKISHLGEFGSVFLVFFFFFFFFFLGGGGVFILNPFLPQITMITREAKEML